MIAVGVAVIRTQIQLTEEQAHELKRMAAMRGLSMAELIRQSVDQFIQTSAQPTHQEKVLRLMEVAGKYAASITDLAENHDDYLDEIYGDDPA